MKKKIFLATHNEGKIQRFKNLLEHTGLDVEVYTPKDLGLGNIEAEENGKTLAENAEIKARAYLGKVNIPILANDTGFLVERRGFCGRAKKKGIGRN